MTIDRSGSAVWTGGLKDGRGTVSTESGALKDQPYAFASRFEGARGTNPEELIGAAHAGCFSMALSKVLEDAGLRPERIETRAVVGLAKTAEGFTIRSVRLTVEAKVPGADAAAFERSANQAKATCPVSRLLNAEITLEARLVGATGASAGAGAG